MNEKTINRIDSFFKIFFNVYFALLILFAAVVLYFNFDTFKGNIEYGINKVQSFFSFSVDQSENDINSEIQVVIPAEYKVLSGASEEERILYAVRNPQFVTFLSSREVLMYEITKDFADKYRGHSDLEIAIAATDFICKKATYADELVDLDYLLPDDSSQCAFGVLVLERGVCKSYTLAFNLLVNATSETINAKYVQGFCGDIDNAHCWSIVYLDGEPYQYDVTWCDDENGWNYNYAFKSDEFMSQSRTWERWRYPECKKSLIVKY